MRPLKARSNHSQKSSTANASSLVPDKLSHTWFTDTQSCPSLAGLVNLSGTGLASAVHVDHTSTHQLFIVPSTVVMERVNVAPRGEEMVAKSCGPCKAPPCLASLYSHTHTDLHVDINTHNLDLQRHPIRVGGWSSASSAVLKNPQCPSNPLNCRKSSTFRSHLAKYLRFCSHRDHLILE